MILTVYKSAPPSSIEILDSAMVHFLTRSGNAWIRLPTNDDRVLVRAVRVPSAQMRHDHGAANSCSRLSVCTVAKSKGNSQCRDPFFHELVKPLGPPLAVLMDNTPVISRKALGICTRARFFLSGTDNDPARRYAGSLLSQRAVPNLLRGHLPVFFQFQRRRVCYFNRDVFD